MASSEAEIKAQGAVEMANDPDSSVTANDAEKKIVDESKKAGAAAFQFDPDATPEEKAAQARAVSWHSFANRLVLYSYLFVACSRGIPPHT